MDLKLPPFLKNPALLALFTAILFLVFIRGRVPPEPKQGGIINAHEHFQSLDEIPKYLAAMERAGVTQTVALGSPEATILKGRSGFSGHEQYNEEAFRIAETYPGRFLVFPTVDVKDEGKLEKLKQYLARGAKGLKLYSGHSSFYERPLDDESMTELYAHCEKEGIPILFHVNSGYYQQEFERVLKRFPRLKVICPHFCLSTINTERLEYLMDQYPHLYLDTSFGHVNFLKDGFLRFSRDPEKYRRLILKYQDRIFFGTDMVVTEAAHKTTDWFYAIAQGYRDLLEQERFSFFVLQGMTLRGLHLPTAVLTKIYRTNFARFLGL